MGAYGNPMNGCVSVCGDKTMHITSMAKPRGYT
jgi:hypothetical protein